MVLRTEGGGDGGGLPIDDALMAMTLRCGSLMQLDVGRQGLGLGRNDIFPCRFPIHYRPKSTRVTDEKADP